MTGYFIFDDIDTRNYDDILVYFNEIDTTPKRVGEFIEIPNRNGSFFLDGGRYEDVEHVYHIAALTKEAGSNLINALASKIGYYRLEDSFNTDEFYSAVFTSGAEPKISSTRDVNTFKVTFTRKPQRFLKSGETAVTVTSGDTLTNPTLFESGPLLKVTGHGDINFNGFTIDIAPRSFRNVNVRGTHSGDVYNLKTNLYNVGDTLYVSGKGFFGIEFPTSSSKSFGDYDEWTMSDSGAGTSHYALRVPRGMEVGTEFSNVPIDSAQSTVVVQNTCSLNVKVNHVSYSVTFVFTATYNKNAGTITFATSTTLDSNFPECTVYTPGYDREVYLTADSTKNVSSTPIYIDCDLGEAYSIVGGAPTSLNSYIDLGSELPKLASGSNTVTFDNTVTELKVTPRWWKL